MINNFFERFYANSIICGVHGGWKFFKAIIMKFEGKRQKELKKKKRIRSVYDLNDC